MRKTESNDDIPTDEMQLARELAREGARVERDNRAFAAMPAAKKRVTIAKDVIAWLDLKKLIPTAGTYLETVATTKVNGYSCNACAVGAMFACQVERTPKLTLEVADYSEYHVDDAAEVATRNYCNAGMRETLGKFFSREQLGLIESAFECMAFDDAEAAEKFGRRYHTEARRMRAIMENIVANGGEFVP
jgi:hypothetical protein